MKFHSNLAVISGIGVHTEALPGRLPTVVDIARAAKVSPATVSRVINQPAKVNPERVAAVMRAMDDLHYTPPPMRNRRGPKSRQLEARSIGVWFIGAPQVSITEWFKDQILLLKPQINQRRISINAFSTESSDRFPRQLETRGLDGVIVQGMEPSESARQRLEKIPNVWMMTRRSENYPGDYVEPDNAANGRMAANYLASRGHRNLAVISTDTGYSAIDQRIVAFCGRCRELGLDVELFQAGPSGQPAYLKSAPAPQTVAGLVRDWTSAQTFATGVYLPADNFVDAFLRNAADAGKRPNRQFEMILGNLSPAIYRQLNNHPPAIDINLSTIVSRTIDQLNWRIDHFDTPGRIGIQVSPTLRLSPHVRVMPGDSTGDGRLRTRASIPPSES